ncbi:MAG: glycosyltransferase family 9 protein [Gemmatimonadaceae bacterium]
MTERVLIVKLAALGDVIMASTLVPAIRARQPQAEITWVVGEGVAPLVRLFDGVSRVVGVNENALFKQGKISGIRTIARTWRAVGRGYDLALIAHTDARYATLGWADGAKATRRFADNLAPRPEHWHGAEYLRLIDNGAGDSVPEYATLQTDKLPAAPTLDGNGALVVIAPGGGRNVLRDDPLRRWPIADWTTAVRALVARGYRVAAVGSSSDQQEGVACAEAGAVDLTGRTSLLELTALINAAHVVVTHDSGTLHLALLLNRPTVALFGPTVPRERIPNGANAIVLSKASDLPCAPCYDGSGYAECAKNLCLSRVSSNEVVNAVVDQIAFPDRCAFQA